MDLNTPTAVDITLTENDIEGAMLQEPLESCTVEQLRWWLLCHGIAAASGDRKYNLIERCENRFFVHTSPIFIILMPLHFSG